MTLSIADRRTIGVRAAEDAAFAARLQQDPRAAIAEATGQEMPEGTRVEVLREGDAWGFVILDPAAIELDLPTPTDARTAVENQTYDLLRDNPALGETMERDPIAFAREWLGLDLSEQGVDLHRETADAVVLLVPNRDEREVLEDDMLDLVAGGGNMNGEQPAQTAPPRAVNKAPA